MNEPAVFGTNLDRPFNWPEDEKPYWSLKCAVNEWDDPPYKPKSIYGDGGVDRLSVKTLCMVGEQGDAAEYKHYDVHSLYGWSQSEPSLKALEAATGKRGLVVSRSTFPTSGTSSGHWLGDNYSSWAQLRVSIIGLLEFNMFGIPYIGADICGFFLDSTADLCQRWMQLGAFYTYSNT
ncbi:PREDICTED: sucrase-isomaltase, intestinal-like, partial [Priapulus caudatus]|uniref:Sucrase-isomaltase, intestinal-like n=1 Tax=Priapulus caudatus TaxID=37621 RepID=A0ABM1DYJ9_PRICU